MFCKNVIWPKWINAWFRFIWLEYFALPNASWHDKRRVGWKVGSGLGAVSIVCERYLRRFGVISELIGTFSTTSNLKKNRKRKEKKIERTICFKLTNAHNNTYADLSFLYSNLSYSKPKIGKYHGQPMVIFVTNFPEAFRIFWDAWPCLARIYCLQLPYLMRHDTTNDEWDKQLALDQGMCRLFANGMYVGLELFRNLLEHFQLRKYTHENIWKRKKKKQKTNLWKQFSRLQIITNAQNYSQLQLTTIRTPICFFWIRIWAIRSGWLTNLTGSRWRRWRCWQQIWTVRNVFQWWIWTRNGILFDLIIKCHCSLCSPRRFRDIFLHNWIQCRYITCISTYANRNH